MEEAEERMYIGNVRELSFQHGKRVGNMELLVRQICRKLKKGEDEEQIAGELETDRLAVEAVCRAAGNGAPDYDWEQVIRILDPSWHP